MLVLIGENDVGKTSVLQALNMLLGDKDKAIDNHIFLKVNNDIIDFNTKDSHPFNYFWFKTEPISDKDIDNKKIHELKYQLSNITNVQYKSERLRSQIDEILDIFMYIDRIMDRLNSKSFIDAIRSNPNQLKDLKNLIDDFLRHRDILVLLYGRKNGQFDIIDDFFSSCETEDKEIDNLKLDIDGLYNIINKYLITNIDRYENVRAWSIEGTRPPLLKWLGSNYYSSEILGEEVGNEEDGYLIYELQQYVKSLYFHGPDTVSVVDDNFLKLYKYEDLLLKESPKKIIAKGKEIKDNLDSYILRKLDNTIIDKLKDLLKDFKSGDSVPIGQRGAGVRRLCSLFKYIVKSYRESSVHKYPTIIAIDEVELSLHPNQQRKLIELLKLLSKDFLFIVTTHSPYVVEELNEDNVCILKKKSGIVTSNPMSERVISDYVSINEINYIAFGEPSIAYHQELFCYMQNKLSRIVRGVRDLNNWLKRWLTSIGDMVRYDWYDVDELEKTLPRGTGLRTGTPNTAKLPEHDATLPYCVRNCIDHSIKGKSYPLYPNAVHTNSAYDSIDYVLKSIKIMRFAIIHNPRYFS